MDVFQIAKAELNEITLKKKKNLFKCGSFMSCMLNLSASMIFLDVQKMF